MSTGFARIVSQLGYKKQLLSPNHVRVVVPGLPYTAFDAFECPSPWSVLNTMDSALTCATLSTQGTGDAGTLLDIHDFFDKDISYAVASKIDFYIPLYNKGVVKSPLTIDSKITHMGNTSVVMDTEMKTDATMLASFRQQAVCVDETNKRPVPIPDWLRTNYNEFCSPGEPIRFTALEKPSNLSLVTRATIGRVQYSDTDSNFHVNFSNYLKYCINGICKEQNPQSKVDRIPPKPLLVKSAFMWFRNECYLGDSLHIEFWEDQSKSNTICVDILRDSKSVFQCILELYEPEKLKSSL